MFRTRHEYKSSSASSLSVEEIRKEQEMQAKVLDQFTSQIQKLVQIGETSKKLKVTTRNEHDSIKKSHKNLLASSKSNLVRRITSESELPARRSKQPTIFFSNGSVAKKHSTKHQLNEARKFRIQLNRLQKKTALPKPEEVQGFAEDVIERIARTSDQNAINFMVVSNRNWIPKLVKRAKERKELVRRASVLQHISELEQLRLHEAKSAQLVEGKISRRTKSLMARCDSLKIC